MIFVTIGTHELPFTRLLSYLEQIDIKEEVIIQSGNTKFNSKKYKTIDFMDKDEFDEYMNRADLVICHSGVGTILATMNRNKKVIVMPRLKEYKEHNDDHQKEICDKFSKLNYIIKCETKDELKVAIDDYKNIKLNEYVNENKRLIDYLENYILSI